MLAHGDVLGEAAVRRMADTVATLTSVLSAVGAHGTLAAGVREKGGHAVSRRQPRDRHAARLHLACDFVPQDHSTLDAAPEDAAHHQVVVVAEAASRHPDKDLSRANFRWRNISDRQFRRVAGLLQD